MVKKINPKLFLLLITILFPTIDARGEEKSEKKLIIAVSEFKPTVIKNKDGSFSGFEIEIFEKFARESNLKFEYKETDFDKMIKEDIPNNRADIGISGITINDERESSGIDFSHRDLDSGLKIMVANAESGNLLIRYGNYILSSINTLTEPEVIYALMTMILFCAIIGTIFWIIEVKKNNPAFHDQGVFSNIITGIYWAVVTSSTVGYGDVTPRRNLGKILSMICILIGIALFGNFVGTISSIKVTKKLESTINAPEDLANKKVATMANTTSVGVLKKYDAVLITTQTIEESYELLLDHSVDAVVFDTPPLMYFESHGGAGKVAFVGSVFERQDYGFAFPEESPLLERFNRFLLKMRNDGSYAELYKKYFGE